MNESTSITAIAISAILLLVSGISYSEYHKTERYKICMETKKVQPQVECAK